MIDIKPEPKVMGVKIIPDMNIKQTGSIITAEIKPVIKQHMAHTIARFWWGRSFLAYASCIGILTNSQSFIVSSHSNGELENTP
jgi:hypothetical protein